MPQIRPVSDLRNNFADISKAVHESTEPVVLTKNDYADMVVMSYEAFEKFQFESEVYLKLKEAEVQAKQKNNRFTNNVGCTPLVNVLKHLSRCLFLQESKKWRVSIMKKEAKNMAAIMKQHTMLL